ncbi:MAG TPA: lysophospholipid acyltransferase family protein [Polyangiaceae bacterium]|nr:lysophospholipid acyltransferase family protein [Polyangiaceae bacterium]
MTGVPSFALDGAVWRRLARWGSSRPEWFVRIAPPVVGLAACAVAAGPRRFVRENLRRVQGRRGAVRDSVDVARTFVGYAACLAEVLGSGSPPAPLPEATVWGELHLLDALSDGRGLLFATAHTAGWEAVGPLLSRDHGLRVMLVERAERDPQARVIQDGARTGRGLLVAHVGDDFLSALPLVRHLRERGAVALQIDRTPPGQRTRDVTLFGARARVPEGPLRLAAATGAPLLPVFAARTGHRRYVVHMGAPIRLPRAPSESAMNAAGQGLASALEHFVRAQPTQWFHFRDG